MIHDFTKHYRVVDGNRPVVINSGEATERGAGDGDMHSSPLSPLFFKNNFPVLPNPMTKCWEGREGEGANRQIAREYLSKAP